MYCDQKSQTIFLKINRKNSPENNFDAFNTIRPFRPRSCQ